MVVDNLHYGVGFFNDNSSYYNKPFEVDGKLQISSFDQNIDSHKFENAYQT
jgi:hypothetical protein